MKSSSGESCLPNSSEFDECFITGTAAEVTPVGEIGPHHYKPGAMTAALIDAYTEEVNPRTKAGVTAGLSVNKRRVGLARRRVTSALLRLVRYPSAATKLSITSFRPALSKSTVSFGPSTATTAPGPNLL